MQLPTDRTVKNVSSSVGTRRQRRRKLAHAEERDLCELAGPEFLEGLLLRLVLEVPVKRLDLGDFVRHAVEDGGLRQIDVLTCFMAL